MRNAKQMRQAAVGAHSLSVRDSIRGVFERWASSRATSASTTAPAPHAVASAELPDCDDTGIGLPPGAAHYRAYVGPPADYDLIAGLTFSLLFAAGLREDEHLLDLGCGSLRVGRLLIPYLRADRYCGIEPNDWLVRQGIAREVGADQVALKRPRFRYVDDFSARAFGEQFKWVVAQSILSHTYPDLAAVALRGVAESLAEDGVLVATFKEGEPAGAGSGWAYPGCTFFRWADMEALLHEAGFVGSRLDWFHPRQTWFAASKSADALAGVVRSVAESTRCRS